MPPVLSLDQLPVEIFLRICCYLDIPDILRIRRVSRYLNEISCCRDIWANAYRKADFVGPPGPFSSQSARDLENALVPCFRVAQSLQQHSGSIKEGETPARKLGAIRYIGTALHVSLVFGRHLLIALSGEVRCYDLNQVDGPFNSNTILYRSTGRTLTSFYCISAIDVDGRPFACIVLKEEDKSGKHTQISIYSLNTTKPSTVTLDLVYRFECSMFNIHSVDLGPRTITVQGSGVTPPINDWCIVVLDIHTRTRFVLPLSDETWKLDEKPEDASFFISSISTSTHIILARSFYVTAAGWRSVFNSYALPLPNTRAGPVTLRLSHHGIIRDAISDHLVLLNDAVCDPSTQDTLIMIRLCAPDSSRCDIPLLKYGTLCLRRFHSGKVGTITFQALGLLGEFPRDLFDRPSFNGAGRTFYAASSGAHGTIAAFEYDVRDAGKDKPDSKVKEYPSILRFPTPRRLLDFDPYCGRICVQSATKRYNLIEIWDLCRKDGDVTKRRRGLCHGWPS